MEYLEPYFEFASNFVPNSVSYDICQNLRNKYSILKMQSISLNNFFFSLPRSSSCSGSMGSISMSFQNGVLQCSLHFLKNCMHMSRKIAKFNFAFLYAMLCLTNLLLYLILLHRNGINSINCQHLSSINSASILCLAFGSMCNSKLEN